MTSIAASMPTPPPAAFNLLQPQRQHRLERSIDIYENERLWIGRGFSQAGLLPTDRVGPFSTRDGSLSWKTLDEAIESLLLRRQGGGNAGEGGSDTIDDNDNIGKDTSETRHRRHRGRGWSFHDAEESNKSSEEHAPTNISNSDNSDQESSVTKNGNDDTIGSISNVDSGASIEAITTGKEDDDYHGFAPYINISNSPGGAKDDGEYHTDGDGWQYFPDFSPRSLSTSCPNHKRGMLDFVRRRKLSRVAVFRPDHFLPKEIHVKCDFCDSDVVDMLSSAMLDSLTLAALFAYGSTDSISDAQALELKCKLIDALSIGDNCRYVNAREGEGGVHNNNDDDYDPWIDINSVKDRLCLFAETCVGKRHGLLAHILHPDNNDVHQNIATFMPVMQTVTSRYLDDRERLSLARLLIKDIDRHSYKMHCNTDHCARHSTEAVGGGANSSGSDDLCIFRIVECSNEGCKATFSFVHQIRHEEEYCQYTILPCPNGCEVKVCRKDVQTHVRDACNLRPATCPLSEFGCNGIVQARDVAQHLNDTADRHFVLLAHRMLEYQTVMKDMSYHIRLLEENNARLERELRTTVASHNQSKHDVEKLSTEMKKMNKRLAAFEGTCRAEFKKVEHDRRSHNK